MSVKRLLPLLLIASLVRPLRAQEGWDATLPLWRRSGASAAFRSLLVPGWGQMYNRQQARGGTFFLLAAGGVTTAFVMDHRARQTYRDYAATGDPGSGLFNRYRRQRNISLVCGGVGAGFWLASVVDAYFRGERLGRIFNEQAGARRFEVAVLPGGAEALWRFGGGDRGKDDL